MKKYSIILIAIFAFCLQALAQQPTIHAILTIDRDDKNIGCEIDEASIKRMLDQAGIEASMPVKYYITDRSISDIKAKIGSLSVGKDDAIFYYYSGHGYRYQNQTSKYPYLALKDASLREAEVAKDEYSPKDSRVNTKNKNVQIPVRANALSLEEISSLIRAKNARVVMTIGDLCNSTIPALEPTPIAASILVFNNYERLFKKSKGYFVVCSSKPGQPSLGSGTIGGLFTNSFLEAYNESVKASTKADWKMIFSKSFDITRAKTATRTDPQTPVVDEINITYID
jgi:hypothetical protein